MIGFRWYVAQALAGLEATALHHLSRAGISAFAPATADRKARLFPGYIFVELEAPNEAGVVNRTRGIHKLLPIHASDPLPLPFGFVDDLRADVAAGAFEDKVENTVRRFIRDEAISFSSGPFRGQNGQFLRHHKGCGVVLAYLLGREIEVERPLQELVPVGLRGEPGARRVGDLVAA